MNKYYVTNKAKAIFINTQPSKTDQSQAQDTDINVIIRRFKTTGIAPGAPKESMYGDFSDIPKDLRTMLQESRNITAYRQKLPEPFRHLPIDQLLALTPELIEKTLTPKKEEPAKEPAK